MTQTWFEMFSVPAMYIASQTVPFVVMDAGDGVPICEGYTLRLDILRLCLSVICQGIL